MSTAHKVIGSFTNGHSPRVLLRDGAGHRKGAGMETLTLDEAWAEAEAAVGTDPVGYSKSDRWDLSVAREYQSSLDDPYCYVARVTQPGIGYIPAEGPTPSAALQALAAALREVNR